MVTQGPKKMSLVVSAVVEFHRWRFDTTPFKTLSISGMSGALISTFIKNRINGKVSKLCRYRHCQEFVLCRIEVQLPRRADG